MPMLEWECSTCSKKFLKYPSQVPNKEHPSCSRACYAARQRTLVGPKCYNWRGGRYNECACGQLKAKNSKQCADCRKTEFSVGAKCPASFEQIVEALYETGNYTAAARSLGISRGTAARVARHIGFQSRQKHGSLLARQLAMYSLTEVEYNELLERQDHSCAICKRHKSTFNRRLAVDHDHSCCDIGSCGSCVRGLLCTGCNSKLSALDDLVWFGEAMKYLGKEVPVR